MNFSSSCRERAVKINPFMRCPNKDCGRFHVITFAVNGFTCACGTLVQPWKIIVGEMS